MTASLSVSSWRITRRSTRSTWARTCWRVAAAGGGLVASTFLTACSRLLVDALAFADQERCTPAILAQRFDKNRGSPEQRRQNGRKRLPQPALVDAIRATLVPLLRRPLIQGTRPFRIRHSPGQERRRWSASALSPVGRHRGSQHLRQARLRHRGGGYRPPGPCPSSEKRLTDRSACTNHPSPSLPGPLRRSGEGCFRCNPSEPGHRHARGAQR